MQATYSPEDNKLRLYPSARLDADEYARAKAAGFRWAPKQDLFFTTWSPGAADLLTEWCGEIEDEDKTLVDRAEERAGRFEDYSANRAADSEAAHRTVDAIADGIPFGQPILVGHHSERHARRDAEKIERGMRRAVKMWETAKYWEARAAGALRHAKYKERPDVRARRIKTIEADQRKAERYTADYAQQLERWESPTLDERGALRITNTGGGLSQCFPLADYPREPPASQYEGQMFLWSAIDGGVITWQQARELAIPHCRRVLAHQARWISHYQLRLGYERAMLGEQTGNDGTTDRWDIQPGGRVLHAGEWLVVIRANKSGGVISSVTATAPLRQRWRTTCKLGVETITDYRPPTAADTAAVKQATAKPPICNYPGPGFHEITKAEWAKIHRDYKGTRAVEASARGAAHRVRSLVRGGHLVGVFLTDQKIKQPDGATPAEAPKLARLQQPPAVAAARQFEPEAAALQPRRPAPTAPDPREAQFAAMRESLRAGVQTVSAPELFPTPPDLVARMVQAAALEPAHRILEPSAGSGNILRGIRYQVGVLGNTTAVEHNGTICANLRDCWGFDDCARIRSADFLACNGDLGEFDRVLMNPPFSNGQDVDHVRHAYNHLKPGGRLVAIMCEGPFFRADRKSADFREWLASLDHSAEPLPPDTFKAAGTSVSTRFVVINREVSQ